MLNPDKKTAFTDDDWEKIDMLWRWASAEQLQQLVDMMEADESMSDPAVAERWCYFKRVLIIAKKEEAKNEQNTNV